MLQARLCDVHPADVDTAADQPRQRDQRRCHDGQRVAADVARQRAQETARRREIVRLFPLHHAAPYGTDWSLDGAMLRKGIMAFQATWLTSPLRGISGVG